ncbi:TetR/AcrR family transcriptional regulator [Actinomadura rudentiformis]|uniref:TetR/AcrR family transcriptional regulator n=1 Tax=Actinomadura rudentiformis TaxID=359158 RepID=A0A6H9YTF1_9ACTN|nr:TetR/AcrR family transcriptional regulator [Actinomadura rudentiformis]KAB2348894.1 TetR/AcrR family transcriptional regulator [Actinomadura rudentiformis]
MDTAASTDRRPRGRNRRGQGERLREDIIEAATRLLDELGDDQALSMRAVAREVGSAATSVYLHFADRDALVLAVLNRCHDQLTQAVDDAEAASDDPVAQLRARTLVLGEWAYQHPGLYKVLHESSLNRRTDMPFKQQLADRTTAAVQRCMDAGLAPADEAATVALDLRAAVHGAVSMRLHQPGHPWPPLEDQIARFLTKLIGIRS